MTHWLICLITFIASSTSQSIVDFTLTDQLTATDTNKRDSFQISIHPTSFKLDYLIFPQACSLASSIYSESLIKSEQLQLLEEQKQIFNFKNDVKKLLSLAEDIRRLKKIVEKPVSLAQLDHEVFTQPNYDFSELQLLQKELQQINSTISAKVIALRNLILHQLNRTKQNGFDEIRLSFEVKALTAQLHFLEKIQQHSSDSQVEFDKLIKECFSQIMESINREGKQLKSLQGLISRFSLREELKIKIANLESQLDGVNMMIQQKEACENKKNELFSRENRKQVELIYQSLKALKAVQSHNSSYCEGVAALLERQLKKIVKIYNYSFACSQGLSELKNTRIVILTELNRLKAEQLDQIYDIQFEKLKKYFESQQQFKAKLLFDIQELRFGDYRLSKLQIERLIHQTKNKLQSINEILTHPPEHQASSIDYSKIREMVTEIELQEYQYCQRKEQYLSKYATEDVNLRSIEHQVALIANEIDSYLHNLVKLKSLEQAFESSRRELIGRLK